MPSGDRASLHANHVFVSLIWREVRQSLGLLDPRVPDHNVGQCLASDCEQSLVIRGGDDNRGSGVELLVDAVGFGSDSQRVGGLGVGACVLGLVDVGLRLKALDTNCRNIL